MTLTHPIRVISEDTTRPLDQLNGHSEWTIFIPLTPGDNPDDLRHHASTHIAAYHDKYAAEQHGKMTPAGFKYVCWQYSRSN